MCTLAGRGGEIYLFESVYRRERGVLCMKRCSGCMLGVWGRGLEGDIQVGGGLREVVCVLGCKGRCVHWVEEDGGIVCVKG